MTASAEGNSGNGYGSHVDPKTFLPVRNRANDWMIDRQMQKTETFTGIDGINQQDRAVQESMGRDRRPDARESGSRRPRRGRDAQAPARGDRQRRARRAIRAASGTSYYEARAAETLLPKGDDWRAELLPRMHPETGGGARAPEEAKPKRSRRPASRTRLRRHAPLAGRARI